MRVLSLSLETASTSIIAGDGIFFKRPRPLL